MHDSCRICLVQSDFRSMLRAKLLLLRSHDFWPRSQVKLILLVINGKVLLYSSKGKVAVSFWVSFQKVKSLRSKVKFTPYIGIMYMSINKYRTTDVNNCTYFWTNDDAKAKALSAFEYHPNLNYLNLHCIRCHYYSLGWLLCCCFRDKQIPSFPSVPIHALTSVVFQRRQNRLFENGPSALEETCQLSHRCLWWQLAAILDSRRLFPHTQPFFVTLSFFVTYLGFRSVGRPKKMSEQSMLGRNRHGV